jgi:recombination protein RecR
MPRLDYPPSFQQLTRQLRALPGIGPRGAERIALWLLSSPRAHPKELSTTITEAVEALHECELCGFFSEKKRCILCSDPDRAAKEICVVENMTDILPLEQTGSFRGRYHALGGRLSPLDGVGPDQLRIQLLIDRIKEEQPSEIILALGVDVEGEATAHYLAELIAPFSIPVTRIAQGLPAGGGVEHADQMTLQRALGYRLPYHV